MARSPALLSLLLAGCTISPVSPPDENAPRLIDAHFRYDVTAITGFTPRPAAWSGDTLTLHDYWALKQQPELRGHSQWIGGELAVSYEVASPLANDWMPSVETRLRILVPTGVGEVKVRFLKMSEARKPSASEDSLGVQDAGRDRLLAVRRP